MGGQSMKWSKRHCKRWILSIVSARDQCLFRL